MDRRSILATISFLLPLAAGQAASTVSIKNAEAFTLAKPCVAHCLWDFGPAGLRSNFYNDWYDVGKELDCGPYPINNCYCDPESASAVSSVMATCVPYYCGKDTPPKSYIYAVSAYNDYCATANGNEKLPVPTAVPVGATGYLSSTTGVPSTSSSSESLSETEPASTSESSESSTSTPPVTTPAESSAPSDTAVSAGKTTGGASSATPEGQTGSGGGGLGQGAIIGIAVGCSVVGIALIGCGVFFFLRKRKSTQAYDSGVGGIKKDEGMGGIQGY